MTKNFKQVNMKYVSGSLYISQNLTKCSSKSFMYTIHGDKFSEQYYKTTPL
jgi:hypothetical protein